jgi:hypothetical protein
MIISLRNTVLTQLLVLMGYILLFSFSTATEEEDVSLSSSCSVSADSDRIDQCVQVDEMISFTARFGIPRNEGKCWYAWTISFAESGAESGGWSEVTAFYALDRSNLTLADEEDDTLTLADPNCTNAFCEAIIRWSGFAFVTPGSRTVQHRFRSYFVPEGEEEEPLDLLSEPFPRLSEDARDVLPFGTLTVTDDNCTYSGHGGVDRSWSVVAAAVVWPLVGLNIIVVAFSTTM